jgi:hypothetical protein
MKALYSSETVYTYILWCSISVYYITSCWRFSFTFTHFSSFYRATCFGLYGHIQAHVQIRQKTLKETLNLPFTYNIKNSIQLINDLNNIPINDNTRICSFDIKYMYTNIPQQDATYVIHNILLNYNET